MKNKELASRLRVIAETCATTRPDMPFLQQTLLDAADRIEGMQDKLLRLCKVTSEEMRFSERHEAQQKLRIQELEREVRMLRLGLRVAAGGSHVN